MKIYFLKSKRSSQTGWIWGCFQVTLWENNYRNHVIILLSNNFFWMTSKENSSVMHCCSVTLHVALCHAIYLHHVTPTIINIMCWPTWESYFREFWCPWLCILLPVATLYMSENECSCSLCLILSQLTYTVAQVAKPLYWTSRVCLVEAKTITGTFGEGENEKLAKYFFPIHSIFLFRE